MNRACLRAILLPSLATAVLVSGGSGASAQETVSHSCDAAGKRANVTVSAPGSGARASNSAPEATSTSRERAIAARQVTAAKRSN